ncbi:MAG: phosphatidylglycerol lysyltransferase domain-containing protein [Microthrixaceae bacterium]|nr:DUF2156 domain-containing protein [Microthrixaceae bacterium]
MGRIVVLAGLWCIIAVPLSLPSSGVAPALVDWVNRGFGLLNIPTDANLFTGAMLGSIGSALVVRKRAALWFVAVGFQGGWLLAALAVTVLRTAEVGAVPKVLLDTPVEVVLFAIETVVAVVLLWVFWRVRGAFTARVAPRALRRSVLALLVGIAISAGIGIVLSELAPGSLHDRFVRAEWAIRTAFGLGADPDIELIRGTGDPWVATAIGAMSTAALVYAGWVFLRSSRLTDFVDTDDEIAVRTLLADYGENDSLGYFATRRDKAVVFSSDRRAAVTYCVEAGASLASADPIGDEASWPSAIEQWRRVAGHHGWEPAVLSASSRGAEAYRRAGLRVLSIGDEAVIEVSAFDIDAAALRPVKRAAARIERAGYHIDRRTHADLDADDLRSLADAAERWRGDEPERGFSMALGRLGDPADGRCVVVRATDATGDLRAFLSFVPWGRRGLSLDLMRRDPDADNGVIEAMVCSLVDTARHVGIDRISLNFAMFREVFSDSERIGAGPVVRMTASLLTAASRWWQLETLYRSSAKYQPRWEPRFLCFSEPLQLNRALLASGIAEGFIALPGRSSRAMPQPASSPALVAAAAELAQRRPRRVDRRLPPQAESRLSKAAQLSAVGLAPYATSVPWRHPIAEVRERFVHLSDGGVSAWEVTVAGRITALRKMGKACFAVVDDGEASIQLLLASDRLDDAFGDWTRFVDLGDLVVATGPVVFTRTGEMTIAVDRWSMVAKCVTPPDPSAPGDPGRRRPDGGPVGGLVEGLVASAAVTRRLCASLESQEFVRYEVSDAEDWEWTLRSLSALGVPRFYTVLHGDDTQGGHPEGPHAEGRRGERARSRDADARGTNAPGADSQGADSQGADALEVVAAAPYVGTEAIRTIVEEVIVHVADVDLREATWLADGGDIDSGAVGGDIGGPIRTAVDRFDLVVDGQRLATVEAIITDPVEQSGRAESDASVDRLVEVLERGVPPTSTLRISVGALMRAERDDGGSRDERGERELLDERDEGGARSGGQDPL